MQLSSRALPTVALHCWHSEKRETLSQSLNSVIYNSDFNDLGFCAVERGDCTPAP